MGWSFPHEQQSRATSCGHRAGPRQAVQTQLIKGSQRLSPPAAELSWI